MQKYNSFVVKLFRQAPKYVVPFVLCDMGGRIAKIATIFIPLKILLSFLDSGLSQSEAHDVSFNISDAQIMIFAPLLLGCYVYLSLMKKFKVNLTTNLIQCLSTNPVREKDKYKFLQIVNGVSAVCFCCCCAGTIFYFSLTVGTAYVSSLALVLLGYLCSRSFRSKFLENSFWFVPSMVFLGLIAIIGDSYISDDNDIFYSILIFLLMRRSAPAYLVWIQSIETWHQRRNIFTF